MRSKAFLTRPRLAWTNNPHAMYDTLRLWTIPGGMPGLLCRCHLAIAVGACGATSPDTTGAVDGAGTGASNSADSANGPNDASGDAGRETAVSRDSALDSAGDVSRSQDAANQDAASADGAS